MPSSIDFHIDLVWNGFFFFYVDLELHDHVILLSMLVTWEFNPWRFRWVYYIGWRVLLILFFYP